MSVEMQLIARYIYKCHYFLASSEYNKEDNFIAWIRWPEVLGFTVMVRA